MTRADQIADVRRQIAATPPHKRKARSILEARLRSLMTRQIAYENKLDRRKAA